MSSDSAFLCDSDVYGVTGFLAMEVSVTSIRILPSEDMRKTGTHVLVTPGWVGSTSTECITLPPKTLKP